jgi:hypothetical protein
LPLSVSSTAAVVLEGGLGALSEVGGLAEPVALAAPVGSGSTGAREAILDRYPTIAMSAARATRG